MLKKKRFMKIVITGMVLVLIMSTMVGCGKSTKNITLKVGSKDFSEQLILGQLTMQALENAGYKTEDKTNVAGSDKCRKALLSGEFDIYWEYTGTGWMTHLQHPDVVTDPKVLFDKVKSEDLDKNGLAWLPYSAMNDTYCVMLRKEDAEANKIVTISDFAKYANANPQLLFSCDQEYTARPDGFPGLEKAYGFKIPDNNLKVMNTGIIYKAMNDKQINAAIGFSTDGRIAGFNLVVLKDDKNYFPVYNAAPVLKKSLLDQYPDIATIMLDISSKLDNNAMTKMNYEVDVNQKEPKVVAKEWLQANKIIK